MAVVRAQTVPFVLERGFTHQRMLRRQGIGQR